MYKAPEHRLLLAAGMRVMSSARDFLERAWVRLRAEPVLHFLLLGGLLFLAHHALVGDPRTIVVTAGVRADLARRFEDARGRKPDAAELDAELRRWTREEALFREALRRRLDRDDPAIRTVLVGKMQAMATAEAPERAPTDEELERWLAAHRERYEAPPRYDFELFELSRSDSDAPRKLERLERAIHEGASPTSLGRPLIGGNLTLAEMKGRVAQQLVERMPSLPPGRWQRVDTDQHLLLVRLKRIGGGLPSLEELRPRLAADLAMAARQEAAERILQTAVDRYRVEERQ